MAEIVALTSHSPGGWKSNLRVSVELVSSEASLLGLWGGLLLLCLHMVFPACTSLGAIAPSQEAGTLDMDVSCFLYHSH